MVNPESTHLTFIPYFHLIIYIIKAIQDDSDGFVLNFLLIYLVIIGGIGHIIIKFRFSRYTKIDRYGIACNGFTNKRILGDVGSLHGTDGEGIFVLGRVGR